MSALQEIAIDLAAEDAVQKQDRPASDAAVSSGPLARLKDWFAKLTIGNKIRAFYTINLCVALLAGVLVIAGYFQLSMRAEQIAHEHHLAMDAERLVTSLSEAQRHSEMYLTTGESVRANAARSQLDNAGTRIAELESELGSGNAVAADRLKLIAQGIDTFRAQIDEFNPASSNTIQRETSAAELQASGSISLEAARDLASFMSDKAKAMSDEGAAFITTLLVLFVGFAGLLIVLTLVAQRYFDRNVSGALSDMTAEMRKLATGNSDVNVPGLDRKDEIGGMARALQIFHRGARRLERLHAERSRKAKAELEEQARIQAQQEEARQERERTLSALADKFERTVGGVVSGVASASSQLHSTSTMMASTASQSSTRASEVSVSMSEARAGATAAAAASDEFAMSIGEISRQAASSAELARKATLTAGEADATISALSDSAQQVGQIVELIQTIAQRTNLLALNASIEAARGGEAGRGFAVVASEVKELAMQTSRATEQVAEQIRAMQDTTGASVTALRSISDQVQELETTAVSIASAVDQQSVAGQDLARSIDLAARGTEQVGSHIDDVRDLSLSTGSAATQVLASATNLEDQAATLRAQVDEFLGTVRVA